MSRLIARSAVVLSAALLCLSLTLPVRAQTPAAAPAPSAAQPDAATPTPAPAPAAAPAPAPAPQPLDPAVQVVRDKLDSTRAALDSLEASLAVEGLRANDLDDLRNRLDPLRRDITARSEDIAPRLSKVKARIQELGTAPAATAPAEDPNITADRQHLQALAADMEAVLKQNRALSIRGDQISDTISTRRRALFTGQLFDRSASILDPRLWADAASALSVEFRALKYLANDWAGFALRQQEWPLVLAMAVGAVLIFAAIYLLGRKLRHRLRCPPPEDGEAYPRFRAARESVKVTVFNALTTPAAAMAAYAFLAGFQLIPPRVGDVLNGLMVAVFIQSIGHALGRGVLAPSEPWRRLLQISDRTARLSYRYFSWTIWTLCIAAFLNALHRALFAPLALTVATSAVMSLLIGSFIARSLIALAREADAEEDTSQTPEAAPGATETPSAVRPSVRFLVWLALAMLMGALVAGYVSFAAFVSARMVIATAVVGGLYLLNALIDSFFLSLRPDTHNARLVSKTLGLRPNRLELIGIVLAAILKLVLVLSACLLVMGTWGASTADVMDSIDRVAFGVRIGNTTITLWNVVYALVLLMIGVLLARGLQKWISSQFLPRTGLEPSLQASIATIIGYVGMILAIAVAMGEVGLNLENIALVAGALSVGIGFGLQSIVSNFVSGLILLAERPIRVGDTISVKGEEGYVRRISVRSTEIETFERSTVIVPNSDLITGMVKNFTHSNTTGRVIVAINATYDADLEEVRDILVACACDHPQVLQSPPPRVFISKLLDAGIVFELRCVVANVDYALTVKSDLHFSILSRFRKAGVGLACQPWAALARAPGDMVPPAPERPAPVVALPLGEPSAS